MIEEKRHRDARSPREELARKRMLVRRALKYWKGTLLVLALGVSTTLAIALCIKHVYRSECTVFAKARIRTDDRDDSLPSGEQAARQAARLKDMLTTRGRLESAIKKYNLYAQTVANKTMLDAVETMKPHVGFRSLEGSQYVITFEGDHPDTVQHVTQFLADSLIADYAAGDLGDVQREADFLSGEERRSLRSLEEATKALTLFLAAHPEFAVEAKQAALTPFGPSPAAGIPLMPKIAKDTGLPADSELGALHQERARLAGEARNAANVGRGVATASAPAKPFDDQLTQSQAEVEAAAKRVAETQADLASKSNLTDDHPDMRLARMSAEAAARQLHEARVKLMALQQLKAKSAVPPLDPSQVPTDIADKLRQIDARIAARRAALGAVRATQAPRTADGDGPPAASTDTVSGAPLVQLETEWQRLLRALNEAKANHDDLKIRAERAKLAAEAAHTQAAERMAVLDPPFRPTHPAKGARANVAFGGLAMALLLAMTYAYARASLDDTLVDADDVEALGLAPVLGVVPKLKLARLLKEACADAAG